VSLEVTALELPGEELAGAKLPNPELLGTTRLVERRERAQLLALYFQSSAPRRHA